MSHPKPTAPPIVAAVIHYRSDPDELERMARSLAGRVRGAVFLDGPYQGLSSDVKADRQEREAIARALPAGSGVQTRLFRGLVYPSEAVKRTAAARAAIMLARDARDLKGESVRWLLVIDTDEELETDLEPPEERGRCGVAHITDPSSRLGAVTMIRLHELTDSLVWGPSHIEVENRGVRYATPHCLPSNPHSFRIRHYPHVRKPSEAYHRYNRKVRPGIEAGSTRSIALPIWPFESREDTIYIGKE